MRFHAPFIDMVVTFTCGSFHRITWWEKYTESCGPARFTSATGTYFPSICMAEFPIWIFAMSLRPGSSTQCEAVISCFIPSAAPHCGQLSRLPSTTARHQGQFFDPVEGRAETGGGTEGAGGAFTT